jgi:polysaccharide export outer membrane protein
MRQTFEIEPHRADVAGTAPVAARSSQIGFREGKEVAMRMVGRGVMIVAACLCAAADLPAQSRAAELSTSTVAAPPSATGAVAVSLPADYVIGPEDQLSVVFWRDKDLSADVVVRPDGKISLPLLNDVQAGGLTPEQLRHNVTEEAKRYVEDPTASVVVRLINSRKVFVTGEVEKPGTYPLAGPTTVLQLLATAGGLKEYAGKDKIIVLRREAGREISFRFNYKQVIQQKNPAQNIELKPGDTVVVP